MPKSFLWFGLLWCLVNPSLPAVAAETVKKPVAKVNSKPSASRTELKSKAGQLAVGVVAAEAALSPQELEIAHQIEVGDVACELGVAVSIKADPIKPGYFNVQGKKFKFRMVPVVTSTGALRLQDARAGAVWLQLANKSMLMNQKAGVRLADACMSPAQMAVSKAMEKDPPPSLLEPVARPTASVASNPAILEAVPQLLVPIEPAVPPAPASSVPTQ